MHLLCGASVVLTEKKEEQPSNTSTVRSCSPLWSAGGHICWFSGPQIINLNTDDSDETWEWHLTHIHRFAHTQASACADTHLITLMQAGLCVHAHTHPVLHNKWWHFNCCACLFTCDYNGWSFSAWQPIIVRQEDCEQPLHNWTYYLTFPFIHNEQ